MNQWEIYAKNTLSNNLGQQESFDFDVQVEKNGIPKSRNTKLGVYKTSSSKANAPKTSSLKTNVSNVSVSQVKTLESVLPTQGWPKSELSEVNCVDSESVLQLLLPTLTKLNAQNRWITLISPPADINLKLFAHYGIDPSRVLLIHPKNDVDDKVTMNKALKNGTSGIVILWASQLNKRYLAQWRKSVKQGNSTGIIINLTQETCFSSSVALSFNVSRQSESLLVSEIKIFGVTQRKNNNFIFSKFDLDATLDGGVFRNHH